MLKSQLQMKEADCVFERRDWGTRFACEHDKAVSSVMVSSTGWCRGIPLMLWEILVMVFRNTKYHVLLGGAIMVARDDVFSY